MHFHKWTKWEDTILVMESMLLGRRLGFPAQFEQPGQRRRCLRCGIVRLRREDS